MVNAVFAFPMNPQQCIARRPTEMDANNAGGGFQPVPGRSEVMVSSPSSRKEQDRNGATAVTSMTVGLSGRLKRHLCDGRVVGDKEQGGPTANKRHKQRGTRGTRVSGVVAVAAAKTAAVMDSNNSYSPAPLRSHIAPQLQAPQYPHLYQHQHQHQRVLAPVQKTVTPCQAISATGRHGEDMWGNWNRAGGEKDSWDKRPSSPSMTLWRLDEGGSSSPSLSSPLDGTVEFTTVGKEMEEETDTTVSKNNNYILIYHVQHLTFIRTLGVQLTISLTPQPHAISERFQLTQEHTIVYCCMYVHDILYYVVGLVFLANFDGTEQL